MLRISLMIAALSAAGCAFSPQQITINPIVDVSGERYGDGRSIAVTVDDRRENKVIGSRGGLYKETSVITISNDLNTAIDKAAEARLATQGFNVNPEAGQEQAKLSVVIHELTYDVPEQTLPKVIVLTGIMAVEIDSNGNKFTKRFETRIERKDVVTPSAQRNEKMINKLISDTLASLFSDEKVKAFLSNI